jgi:hypothetical protein
LYYGKFLSALEIFMLILEVLCVCIYTGEGIEGSGGKAVAGKGGCGDLPGVVRGPTPDQDRETKKTRS